MPSSKARLNLARKYRPHRLEDVVGQELAIKTLSEALKHDRIAPAYLFSGPRGTGKTTCARIFAKAAACLSKKLESRPCEECVSCIAYASGKNMDLIEIDGASHTGVDDARSIVESIAFRPSTGKRSVYIIDEVHMLSNAAFNALLKTLEEPPAHALFLFATTEPEKIPQTILSRVQRIELQRIKEPLIVSTLKSICAKENVKADEKLLKQIAIHADGALRDSETLLEQLVLLSGGETLDAIFVEAFLGTVGADQEIEILSLIASAHTNEKEAVQKVLEKISLFYQGGKDLNRLLQRLIVWTRGLLISKATNSDSLLKDEYDEPSLKKLIEAFGTWSVEDLDQLFEIFWAGSDRLKKSELPLVTLETTLIRACRVVLTEDLSRLIRQLESNSESSSVAPVYMPAPKPAPTPAPTITTKIVTSAEGAIEELRRKKPSLHALLQSSESKEWNEDQIIFRFPKGHFAYRQLTEKTLFADLQTHLRLICNNPSLVLSVVEAQNTKLAEPAKPAANMSFMKEAHQKAITDASVQRASQILQGRVESVVVSGIKTEIDKAH